MKVSWAMDWLLRAVAPDPQVGAIASLDKVSALKPSQGSDMWGLGGLVPPAGCAVLGCTSVLGITLVTSATSAQDNRFLWVLFRRNPVIQPLTGRRYSWQQAALTRAINWNNYINTEQLVFPPSWSLMLHDLSVAGMSPTSFGKKVPETDPVKEIWTDVLVKGAVGKGSYLEQALVGCVKILQHPVMKQREFFAVLLAVNRLLNAPSHYSLLFLLSLWIPV